MIRALLGRVGWRVRRRWITIGQSRAPAVVVVVGIGENRIVADLIVDIALTAHPRLMTGFDQRHASVRRA